MKTEQQDRKNAAEESQLDGGADELRKLVVPKDGFRKPVREVLSALVEIVDACTSLDPDDSYAPVKSNVLMLHRDFRAKVLAPLLEPSFNEYLLSLPNDTPEERIAVADWLNRTLAETALCLNLATEGEHGEVTRVPSVIKPKINIVTKEVVYDFVSATPGERGRLISTCETFPSPLRLTASPLRGGPGRTHIYEPVTGGDKSEMRLSADEAFAFRLRKQIEWAYVASGLTQLEIGRRMAPDALNPHRIVHDLLHKDAEPGILRVARFAAAVGLSLVELLELSKGPVSLTDRRPKKAMSIDALRVAMMEAKKRSGLTLEKIGEVLGLDPTGVSKLMNRSKDPNIVGVHRFAAAVGLSLPGLLKLSK